MPPDLRRDPGIGCVDHLHRHAPLALCNRPTPWATSKAITGFYAENRTTFTQCDSNQEENLQFDE